MKPSPYTVRSDRDGRLMAPRKPIPSKYPFGTMKVGDYFDVVPAERSAVATAASRYGARHDKTFCVKSPARGSGRLVCMRVA